MSQVFRISLTKADLDKIPHDERVFYLMVGQLSNDINILTKILWFAFSQHMKTDGVVKDASSSPDTFNERIYDQLPSNGELPEYWGTEYAGYNLFYGSEIITVMAMMKVTGESDQTKAMQKIFSETTGVSVWFGQFVQNYDSLLLSIFLGMTQEDVGRVPSIAFAMNWRSIRFRCRFSAFRLTGCADFP
jgi:hypothetical protein